MSGDREAVCPCGCGAQMVDGKPFADHPHTDPGDGRTECQTCGKWVFMVIHSCKGVPVTAAARERLRASMSPTSPTADAGGASLTAAEAVEALADATFEALDRQHDEARHVHAAECCWPFAGVSAALREGVSSARASTAQDEGAGEVERLRDLTRRLGFGDNITEPQADNDTIVKYVEERFAEASEWVESQSWRTDCYLAGHPEDEDCWEHDPSLRLLAAETKVAAVEALAERWDRLADRNEIAWGRSTKVAAYYRKHAAELRAVVDRAKDGA